MPRLAFCWILPAFISLGWTKPDCSWHCRKLAIFFMTSDFKVPNQQLKTGLIVCIRTYTLTCPSICITGRKLGRKSSKRTLIYQDQLCLLWICISTKGMGNFQRSVSLQIFIACLRMHLLRMSSESSIHLMCNPTNLNSLAGFIDFSKVYKFRKFKNFQTLHKVSKTNVIWHACVFDFIQGITDNCTMHFKQCTWDSNLEIINGRECGPVLFFTRNLNRSII